MVDNYKDNNALKENVRKEFDRNKERYEFLKWGQSSFDNFYLVPPGCRNLSSSKFRKYS